MLHFVVSSSGFSHATISVPSGKYVISVANRTGTPDLPIVFERVPPAQSQAAEKLKDSVVDKHTNRFFHPIQLANGTYRLRVTSRPTWTLTIEVQ